MYGNEEVMEAIMQLYPEKDHRSCMDHYLKCPEDLRKARYIQLNKIDHAKAEDAEGKIGGVNWGKIKENAYVTWCVKEGGYHGDGSDEWKKWEKVIAGIR